ncbi:MAG: ATP-binding protein [Succiniclasticum sp.]|nr:ATP-binding protein [Succiniclasticum sp.]MDY6346421.1 ATP-binding protein [Succiniclasticum sp.]
MNKSLSTRLMYSFMAIIVIVVVGVSAGTSYLIADYFVKLREEQLSERGREMANTVEYFFQNDTNHYMLMRYLIAVDHLVGARIWLFDDRYNLIAASNIAADVDAAAKEHGGRNSIKPDVAAPADLIPRFEYTSRLAEEIKSGTVSYHVNKILADIYDGGTIRSQVYHPYFKQQVMLVGVPYSSANGQKGAILLAEPMSGFGGILRNIYIFTAIVGLVALLISLFMVRHLTKLIVKPLLSMKDATVAIAKGNYSVKVDVHGEDEVAELGLAINHLSEELSSYLGKLARMEKTRRDFVANVSHELRTPITIIRGYVEIIHDNLSEAVEDESVNKRYCDLISKETQRLERLVRALLDISRLQASGKLTPAEMEELPMADIIRSVAEQLKVKADPKHITISMQLDESCRLYGNGDQMVQLVLILGDNAIKYSPEGSFVRYETKQLEDGSFEMTVVDNGPGIPEADLPYIFDRFYKVDKSHCNSATKGTGLGLAIAKEIVRRHRGRLEVFSKLGQGTRFMVTFPPEAVVRGDNHE